MYKNSIFPYKSISTGSSFLSGYAFKSKDFSDEGIPVIKIKNIQNRRVNYLDDQFFPVEFMSTKFGKYKIYRNDVLIAMTGQGSVGRVGQVKEMKGTYGLLNQRVGKFICDDINLNRDYLFYVISSNVYEDFLFNKAIGSGQPNLSPSDILEVEIPLPPLPEQKAIANILSAIDDKIENNLAINKTLEDMAMALYKHWFVDFDFPISKESHPELVSGSQPIGYKSAGGEFIDSELGPIPKGWEVKRLDEVTIMFAGGDKPKIFSKEETEDLKIPIYSNGISNEGLYGFTDKARVIDESVTVSARGTIGFVCLRMEPFLPIVRLVTVVPNKEYLSNKYLFLCLKNQNIQGNGTTQQQLTVPDFKETRIIVPNLKIIKDFTVAIDSFYKNIRTNKKENQSLTQLRDTLLPKLISGEVRLKEFKEQVESVIAREE